MHIWSTSSHLPLIRNVSSSCTPRLIHIVQWEETQEIGMIRWSRNLLHKCMLDLNSNTKAAAPMSDWFRHKVLKTVSWYDVKKIMKLHISLPVAGGFARLDHIVNYRDRFRPQKPGSTLLRCKRALWEHQWMESLLYWIILPCLLLPIEVFPRSFS